MKTLSLALSVVAVLAMAAVPAGAQQVAVDLGSPWAGGADAIPNGVDAWRTAGGQWTFYSFADNPLPADFFCSGSEPFTDTIYFNGRPVATHPTGAFGEADTIVERIDRAEFGADGVAETRVVVRALSLVSSAPVVTRCGDFDVAVTLADHEQPVQTMRFRKTAGLGGYALAPLDLDIKLAFTPVGSSGGPTHEVLAEIRFPGLNMPWQAETRKLNLRRAGMVMVDSDGDGTPDLSVPGARHVQLGWVGEEYDAIGDCPAIPVYTPGGIADRGFCAPICHYAGGEDEHCYYP